MELRHLRYFVKLADTLSFSEAARELCITQSSLSQQIKLLEQEFNTQLFFRDSHSVEISEAGAELLPFARNAISAADLCRDRMSDLQDMLVGTLNIGVTYSFSPILSETIFSFMHRFKGVKLNVFYKPMAELMEMLNRREVDFVLAYRPSLPMPGIESHILFQNYLAAIVSRSHPLAKQDSVSINELSRYSFALPSKGLQARNALEQIRERHPFDLKIRIELNDPNILLELVKQSNMVTILAEASVRNSTDVKAVKLDIPDNEMDGCVHTLANSYHKRSMKEFVRILSESIAVKVRANAWL
ncbi:MAG: LysR family transcriptional regulator [Bacteroidales bacterium]|nr:LysR family transcriptional regulator [Bacteroidales bacterium]